MLKAFKGTKPVNDSLFSGTQKKIFQEMYQWFCVYSQVQCCSLLNIFFCVLNWKCIKYCSYLPSWTSCQVSWWNTTLLSVTSGSVLKFWVANIGVSFPSLIEFISWFCSIPQTNVLMFSSNNVSLTNLKTQDMLKENAKVGTKAFLDFKQFLIDVYEMA